MDSDEIVHDEEACDFMEKDRHEKNYKIKWYKDNAEKISQKGAELYDPQKKKSNIQGAQ